MHLPAAIAKACQPLFDYLPLDEAMPTLVGEQPDGNAIGLCEQAVADPAIADRPSLVAGLWLYVDQLDKSHAVSQHIQNPTGSFWHGIMHRREGDFSNSHYWFRRVGTHPVFSRIDVAGGSAGSGTDTAGYDPHAFIDAVEHAETHDRDDTVPNPDGEMHPELLATQRREWAELFAHCAEQRR
ncbi:MAG: hypothetical protein AAGB29_07095 [Planctomycetota bacterium]